MNKKCDNNNTNLLPDTINCHRSVVSAGLSTKLSLGSPPVARIARAPRIYFISPILNCCASRLTCKTKKKVKTKNNGKSNYFMLVLSSNTHLEQCHANARVRCHCYVLTDDHNYGEFLMCKMNWVYSCKNASVRRRDVNKL